MDIVKECLKPAKFKELGEGVPYRMFVRQIGDFKIFCCLFKNGYRFILTKDKFCIILHDFKMETSMSTIRDFMSRTLTYFKSLKKFKKHWRVNL